MEQSDKYHYVKDYRYRGLYCEEEYSEICNETAIKYDSIFKSKKEAAEAFVKENYAYHFTSLENIESILRNGLLSHKRKRNQGISHFDVSKNDIQTRRENMEIPDGQGKTVHDYVPFYFSNRTPMLLSVINRKIIDQREIVYIAISLNKLKSPNVIFTDASANTAEAPDFYNCIEDLFKLDWRIISSPKWGYDEADKKKKMAEVLVPDSLMIDDIDYFVVFDNTAEKRLKGILDKLGCKTSIEINETKYKYYYYKRIEGRESESLITGPNELLKICHDIYDEVIASKNSNRNKLRFLNIYKMLDSIQNDFETITELRDLKDLESSNPMHSQTADEHTKQVVSNLDHQVFFSELTQEKQTVLRLAAYFHDTGKGPKSKWPDGKQPDYEDHPVDSLKKLERILIEEIEDISEYQVKMLCVLVAYHDLLGGIYGKAENEKRSEDEYSRIKNEFNLEPDDIKMLLNLSLADSESIRTEWRDAIYEQKEAILLR